MKGQSEADRKMAVLASVEITNFKGPTVPVKYLPACMVLY